MKIFAVVALFVGVAALILLPSMPGGNRNVSRQELVRAYVHEDLPVGEYVIMDIRTQDENVIYRLVDKSATQLDFVVIKGKRNRRLDEVGSTIKVNFVGAVEFIPRPR